MRPVPAVPPRVIVPDVWLVPMFNAVVVPENVTAPVALRVAPCTKAVAMTLPPVTLPEADNVVPCTRVVAITLPPLTLPVADINPAVVTLPAMTLAVALTVPAVIRLYTIEVGTVNGVKEFQVIVVCGETVKLLVLESTNEVA